MPREYNDVFSLIEHDSRSREYFNKLPVYIQEMIQQRAGSVHSFEALKKYAENLTQYDE